MPGKSLDFEVLLWGNSGSIKLIFTKQYSVICQTAIKQARFAPLTLTGTSAYAIGLIHELDVSRNTTVLEHSESQLNIHAR